MGLLSFLQEQKIVRPGYATLQIIVRDMLNVERNRLCTIINESLQENDKESLQKLLLEEDVLSGLAALKQDAKDLKARMMKAERKKLATIKLLYQVVKKLLPKLNLSKQNINYYAILIHYYSIYELRKKLVPSQTYLYMLCYIWLRYQQLHDNLIDAFCYHFKQFEDKNKLAAFYQYKKQEQNEQLLINGFAMLFVEESLSDATHFGEVRKQAFIDIMPKEKLREKLFRLSKKIMKEIDFRWKDIDKIAIQFKNHLRPLAMTIDFASTLPNSPWLAALAWFKRIFAKQKSLRKQSVNACPAGTIPKRLYSYLTETSDDGKSIIINAGRYEFWIYRQIKKRIRSGELYVEDSIQHNSLQKKLVSLKDRVAILQQLNIKILQQPIEKILDEKFAELHELWIAFNNDLKNGKLKHLRYDEVKKTLHLRKPKNKKDEELQQRFYEPLPHWDIADIFRFVNEHCPYLSVFIHIQPRYVKQPIDEDSLIAVIIAQALNYGNLNMAEICDIPYHVLQDTCQSRIRLATLKAANDMISNDIARMPIFPHYSIDLHVLYGGVDGQKFQVERPTAKARHSKKIL